MLEEEPEPAAENKTEPYRDSQGMVVDPAQEAAHRARVEPEIAWMQLRANKGLSEAAHIRVLTDFIRAKGLFPELNAFATKQLRR